jgi:hypothetical protein
MIGGTYGIVMINVIRLVWYLLEIFPINPINPKNHGSDLINQLVFQPSKINRN